MKLLNILLISGIVAMLVLSGCVQQPETGNGAGLPTGGNDISGNGPDDTTPLSGGGTAAGGGGTEANAKEFDVTAKQFEFVPGVITVNEGDTVRLNVTSVDVAHGISIPEFGVNERIEVGQTAIVEFVADQKGTFTMHCSVFCGTGHGLMKGTLIVE